MQIPYGYRGEKLLPLLGRMHATRKKPLRLGGLIQKVNGNFLSSNVGFRTIGGLSSDPVEGQCKPHVFDLSCGTQAAPARREGV